MLTPIKWLLAGIGLLVGASSAIIVVQTFWEHRSAFWEHQTASHEASVPQLPDQVVAPILGNCKAAFLAWERMPDGPLKQAGLMRFKKIYGTLNFHNNCVGNPRDSVQPQPVQSSSSPL